MRSNLLSLCMLGGALAARPFVNEPDTGFDEYFASLATGELPPLNKLVGLPDFDAAARRHLPAMNYTYYRNGAGGEWSYRNNLEVYNRYRLKPKTMVDVTNIEASLPTTILGHNFSAPFFITPCARGGYGHVDGEKGLVEGAANGNILYMPSLYASLTIEQITAFKKNDQVTFQQVYLDSNDTATQIIFDRAKTADAKAIVFTIDSAADGNRHRAARYGVGSADSSYTVITWDLYDHLTTMTDLPIILKGIQTVEDAQEAVRHKVPAIYLSNHGGRQIDGARSPLEVAIELRQRAPEVFTQTEVYADGGVRYGADVVKLLALGVKAVGVGRPFMYANVYGTEGVSRAVEMLKHEIAIDAANAGVADLKRIDPNIVDWTPNWASA
ncbi:FMN-dependent alpha-hydroxy acid dehydrogenase [Annulohypoxylon maeteangense]|uniref:FMN-dependent alpha-hydroxy acid dehydrogenase n=1 Tax=Annulohypoxylon maeteangense TaxID=1927788 RepID=UPI002007B20C|nr:FMN-dependent alpha-hydroxy acid dehydrogenase [Annulohypoxylon maeteangense]KAI0880502.1 FMN-dependent alpha-hydroxy acid dehydrogenase [Annulohypoxylon maeteangense]